MNVAVKIPARMSVAEFLAWCPEDGQLWQLIDGEPVVMAPPAVTHGLIQAEIAGLLGNHLFERGQSLAVATAVGVIPHVHAKQNLRLADMAVIDFPPDARNDGYIRFPRLVIEVLSPDNPAESWANVWAYTSIPSVREILVVSSLEITADLLRRRPDGAWPENPTLISAGEIVLEAIDYRGPLAGFYRTTHLVYPADPPASPRLSVPSCR